MDKIVIGILAHVDSGKTTLAEALLYTTGALKKIGRVDKKDAFLDSYELEKSRGITIFSKQAIFTHKNKEIFLLDTPGHVDFSTEMERTLQVLDYAILVISATGEITGHTKTLWNLLYKYHLPVFIFINKIDHPSYNKQKVISKIQSQLNENCFVFTDSDELYENLAMCSENLMEVYVENNMIEQNIIKESIANRIVFPCYLGSALKLEGVKDFIDDICDLIIIKKYKEKFAAKVFKITKDQFGNRETHLKIIGGNLTVRDQIKIGDEIEKINQIRLYSGEKYEAIQSIASGGICAVTGLLNTFIGDVIGAEANDYIPIIEPILTYQVLVPPGYNEKIVYSNLLQLQEEDPMLCVLWDEILKEIQIKIMGDIQIEILQHIAKKRFDIDLYFGEGKVLYKESISDTVEGIGHFEPLRHYAEVHVLLEALPRGSGIQIVNICLDDMLEKNYQKQVLFSLQNECHRGVLTGSEITDIKISFVTGKSHNKHTSPGDFREATVRAVRQGLMQAKSVLLEPYYRFEIIVPENMLGRVLNDVDRMYSKTDAPNIINQDAIITGIAPVTTMRNYQKELISYTKGFGKMTLIFDSYGICHNTDEVIEQISYNVEKDTTNPTSSIFCKNGSGYVVPWDEVENHMHIERILKEKNTNFRHNTVTSISIDEVDQIIQQTSRANSGKKSSWNNIKKTTKEAYVITAPKYNKQKEYLLVDAYNIIFAWEELRQFAQDNIDSARTQLLEYLTNYQAIRKCEILVVFDAYKVKRPSAEITKYNNIYLIFTKEAQTADHYIEHFVHENIK
ncbi:MAG: translation elongation factor G, partial [Epulopiscium sp. Nele67-Bin001]